MMLLRAALRLGGTADGVVVIVRIQCDAIERRETVTWFTNKHRLYGVDSPLVMAMNVDISGVSYI
ncbi:hypothetical protein CS006_08550 [Bifidobacterium primatium]|uniref:Uncharacterized protein n=1 Tax=Bifidobacterium primatium TaxID=2045438 RepID=A0A2M9H739_9BIFI|nr:hypothetical protein CS006_08550 [Bifidobacterium primatium]